MTIMNLWDVFTELVAREFNFLETDFSFRIKSVELPFVIYKSNELQIDLFYDINRQRELDLRIRKLGEDPRISKSVGIGMLMRIKEGESSEGYMSPFPSTEESLRKEVHRLAKLLKKYGKDIFQGDMGDFERIEQREREIEKLYGQADKTK